MFFRIFKTFVSSHFQTEEGLQEVVGGSRLCDSRQKHSRAQGSLPGPRVFREPSGEGRHRDLRTPPKRNHSESQEKFPSNFSILRSIFCFNIMNELINKGLKLNHHFRKKSC